MPFISASAISPYNVNSNLVGEKAFTFGNALYFDGTDDRLTFTNTDTLAGLNKMSFSFWTKDNNWAMSSNLSTDSRIFMRFDSVNVNRVQLSFRTASQGLKSYGSAQIEPKLVAGKNHWVVVYDGTQAVLNDRIQLYLNSALIEGSGSNIPTSLNSNVLRNFDIGGFFANVMDGAINEFALDVGKALNQTEVNSLYNLGDGADYISAIGTPYIYCRMNESDGALTALNEGTLAVNGTLVNFFTPPAYFKPYI